MPSRSYVPHHQLPGSIHRELSDPSQMLRSDHSAYRASPPNRGLANPDGDDSKPSNVTSGSDEANRPPRGAGEREDESDPTLPADLTSDRVMVRYLECDEDCWDSNGPFPDEEGQPVGGSARREDRLLTTRDACCPASQERKPARFFTSSE